MLVASSFLLRVQSLAQRVREREEQRADERIRIARDLHDTLLQGVQGLMLTFHVAAKSIPEESHTRHLLERALQSADRLVIEGRNRVGDLRGDSLTDRLELATALEYVGEELNAKDQKTFRTASCGRLIPIKPAVLAELFLVGREAISNAFRHSGAITIEVTLQYEADKFTMICGDDGCGILCGQGPAQPDRWGLKGMAERMERLGGSFAIQDRPGAGTLIIASLPARRVYIAAGFLSALRSRILGPGKRSEFSD